jgi:ribosome biogenesis protein UTP30
MVAKSTTKKPTQMVNSELLNNAIKALLKHHNESDSKSALLGNDLPVQVQFTLARIPEKTSARPIRVEIPHPLHKVLQTSEDKDQHQDGLDEVEVCLIVKDESKQWVKELLEQFPSHTSCIKKVLTLTSLRKKYTQYKDRRELLKRYDLFLADDRILPMLGKALGKNFFQEKKQPIPLKLTRKEALPFAIQRCLKSSYMFISPGTCVSIKAGNTAMSLEYLVENVEAILANAVKHIPRKWSNVSAVNVKTSQSVALPVYNKTREELEEIARMAKVDASSTAEEKKRAREEEEEEAELAEEESARTKKQKKELAAKSPLVKALKKTQKKNKHDGKAAEATTPSKKKKKTNSDSVEEKEVVELADEEATRSKKQKKELAAKSPLVKALKKKNKHDGEASEATTPSKKKKKTNSDSVEEKEVVKATPKSSKKKKSKEKEDVAAETPKSSKKKKSDEEGSSKTFISSKKYKGSKKSFVFKMGSRGVGYYVDIKPVPDKMALAAIARMGKGGGGRRESAGKSRKGGRRTRR